MNTRVDDKVAIVVPNWNGKKVIGQCLDSLLSQSMGSQIIVVENGSTDGSLEFIRNTYPDFSIVVNKKNLGFAGGVNTGIKKAFDDHNDFIVLFNNDAAAEKNWLENLLREIKKGNKVGIVTCKFKDAAKTGLDSTGDLYTNWGLPFPRGRGETDNNQYDNQKYVFAASGGASIYRTSMLKEIGLFDTNFFAYYEDVDLSFRAQLAGWKVRYCPEAVAYHQIGATSRKIKGFTTYQTMKNLPWLFWKNVPAKYLYKVGWRFKLAYFSFFVSAISRGQGWPALKGLLVSLSYMPKKLWQRWYIQHSRKVPDEYIWGLMMHDLPPNAHRLRKVRATWWKLTGRKERQ